MKETVKEAVRKVGNTEIKISPELFSKIRERVKKLFDVPPDQIPSYSHVASVISPEFPQFSERTLTEYVSCSLLPGKVSDAFVNGTVSFKMMSELSTGLEEGMAEYLLAEVIERDMSVSQLAKAKGLMKGRRVDSWPAALDWATGKFVQEAPKPPPTRKRAFSAYAANDEAKVESYDDLVNDIILSGTKWRNKVRTAILMASSLSDEERAHVSFAIFNKIYMLRNTILEQFEFVDKTVKDVLDRMESRGNSPSGFKEPCDDAGHGNPERREGGEGSGGPPCPEVHDVRPPLQAGSGEEGGQVRS